MAPVRILRRRQQLVVATRVAPGAQVICVQIAIHLFQPRHFLRAAAVVTGDPPGQLAVFHFQLRANQLNAELIGPRLQYQRRGGGANRHFRTGINFVGDSHDPFRAHQLVPVFFTEGLCLLT